MKRLSCLCFSLLMAVPLFSCAQESEKSLQNPIESSLKGAFASSEAIYTKIKHAVTDGQYLYAWKYPQFLLSEDQDVLYRVDQRLELKRNFTYNFNYTIILGNPGDWGNLEIAKIAVNVSGVFSFHEIPDSNRYSVNLSNPTGGSEEIYGCNINNMSWFGGWTMHAQPDMVNSFDELSKTEFVSFSKYVSARTVSVETTADNNKVLYSDLFYRDCLEDIALYSTY